MPAPEWENLGDFFNLSDFALSVEFLPSSGASFFVNAIFDNMYMDTDLGEYDAEMNAPRLTCKAEDVESVLRGDRVVVDGVTYDIMTGPQTDGTGLAVIKLGEQPADQYAVL